MGDELTPGNMNTPESKLPPAPDEEARGESETSSASGPGVQHTPGQEIVSGPAGPAAGVAQAAAAELPEDLRAPWTWVDLLVFVFFGLGAMIVLSDVTVLVLAVVFHIGPAAIEKAPTARAAFATLHQWLWSVTVMLYLSLMVRVRFGTPFWRTMGWRDLRLKGIGRVLGYLMCLVGGSAFAFAIQMASAFVGTEATLPIEALFRSRESVLLVMATGILVAPLVEETIFRGYLYPVLARALGVSGGVILTGMLFGLMHAAQLWGGWGQIALLMVVGIVFTYVRARTGTVLAPYLLHLGYNALLFTAFYFATGRLRHLPGSS